ncbi:MAG: glycosyltransferase family 4 protein, partial [Lachnospiraceae bacterium]|nr:glycosyltransferase family 4 protein [Lachnospiraceae bacterium]
IIVNRKISELISIRKVDIIQFSSIRSWSILYYGKIPATMRLSSYDKLYYRDYPNKTIANTRAFLQRLAAKRCTAVFAPSKVNANAFAKDTHRRVQVIETPFWNECSEYDASVYHNRLEGKKYFLFFGRLTITKGVLVIANILERFLELNREYYFVCCGIEQGGCKENLVRSLRNGAGKYRDRFIYVKALPHNSLYPIVMQADFVICPSFIENFSNTCMEAMYFERVVIGTDGASYEQLIDDGENGLLCIPGDSESLLDKMNEAAAMNEAQKTEMGRKARRRIDKLAPEIMVKKLVRYYQYVIEHSTDILKEF